MSHFLIANAVVGEKIKIDETLSRNLKIEIGSKIILQQEMQKQKIKHARLSFLCDEINKEIFCKAVEFSATTEK
jgi:hypothetical protein